VDAVLFAEPVAWADAALEADEAADEAAELDAADPEDWTPEIADEWEAEIDEATCGGTLRVNQINGKRTLCCWLGRLVRRFRSRGRRGRRTRWLWLARRRCTTPLRRLQ
jgi:hypothetical protein